MRPPRLAAALLLLALVAAPRLARAGEAEAGEAFKAGAAAYAKGDYRAAAVSFERAYREAPRGAAIYNAGLAWEAGGDPVHAANDYATAIGAGDLSAEKTSDARVRLGALDKTLGRLEVAAPAGAMVAIGGGEAIAAPASVRVAPGAQQVTARFTDGTTARRDVSVAAGGSATVAFDPPRPALAPPPAVPASTPTSSSSGSREPSAPPRTQRIVGFVTLGGAVVASGAAVVLGLSAVSAKNDFDASGHHDQSAHDRADQLRTVTNVVWIAAGALAATGVVLVLTAPRARSAPQTTATLGPTGASLSVRF